MLDGRFVRTIVVYGTFTGETDSSNNVESLKLVILEKNGYLEWQHNPSPQKYCLDY